jgi:hypothetical protein
MSMFGSISTVGAFVSNDTGFIDPLGTSVDHRWSDIRILGPCGLWPNLHGRLPHDL